MKINNREYVGLGVVCRICRASIRRNRRRTVNHVCAECDRAGDGDLLTDCQMAHAVFLGSRSLLRKREHYRILALVDLANNEDK